ncbi:379_t:CDS:2 [Diversispora eburnea]|uniref:379_t:CDS:1 n=1 Tax=Diversispora eburnea TaxID=1213867 RepID=A0A9N8V6X0_9GLOM|nr:379_t:CDS:2 [Diversispora eburnea]
MWIVDEKKWDEDVRDRTVSLDLAEKWKDFQKGLLNDEIKTQSLMLLKCLEIGKNTKLQEESEDKSKILAKRKEREEELNRWLYLKRKPLPALPKKQNTLQKLGSRIKTKIPKTSIGRKQKTSSPIIYCSNRKQMIESDKACEKEGDKKELPNLPNPRERKPTRILWRNQRSEVKRQKQEFLDKIKSLEEKISCQEEENKQLKASTPQELIKEINELKTQLERLQQQNSQLIAQVEVKETKKRP